MVFSTEDRILLKSLYLLKGYNVTRSLAELQEKNWEKAGIKKLLRFIVHSENCRLSSIKNNVTCAIYNFIRYCSACLRFFLKQSNCFVVNLILNSMSKKI
jgi:hypothetical protein